VLSRARDQGIYLEELLLGMCLPYRKQDECKQLLKRKTGNM
jgi:hypothetical protein